MDIALKVVRSPQVEVLIHLEVGGCEQVTSPLPYRPLTPRLPPK